MWEILRSFKKKPTDHIQGLDSPNALKLRGASASVNFKDLNLTLEDDEDEPPPTSGGGADDQPVPSEASSCSPKQLRPRRLERNKLIIIMVGLPGRGKTFLCNKLKCYLNWLGHDTKLFNVGNYRRLQKGEHEVQDASFFDRNNQHGLEARKRALDAALADLVCYLESDAGQVAIFDATNTTEERRQHLISKFHGKYQYLFIESICTDVKILEANYRYKMRYSPDYQGVDEEQALRDFKERIHKYEEVYDPITDRTRHYIKLIDMVTGRGHMDVNRISGYLPGKIVFFLMQVCKAGIAQERKIWLTRHGESQYNLLEKIGGNSSLSARGEEYARLLPDKLVDRLPLTFEEQMSPVGVWTSTLKRTIETANYLPFPKLRWKALDEIHAGSMDGMTYDEIAVAFPEEFAARKADKLRYRYPAGESYLDVIQRLEPVVIELEREKESVCIVAHQAVLRAIYGYFTASPLQDIPTLEIPLHTLIELRPRPDGTMHVEMLPIPVTAKPDDTVSSLLVRPSNPPQSKLPIQVPFGATSATPGATPATAFAGNAAQQLLQLQRADTSVSSPTLSYASTSHASLRSYSRVAAGDDGSSTAPSSAARSEVPGTPVSTGGRSVKSSGGSGTGGSQNTRRTLFKGASRFGPGAEGAPTPVLFNGGKTMGGEREEGEGQGEDAAEDLQELLEDAEEQAAAGADGQQQQ